MLKPTLLAAAALACALSSAQGMMTMVPDSKMTQPKELMEFLRKDSYMKLSSPDAYYLNQFIGGLPGNYQSALLRGLVLNAEECKMSYDKMRMSPMAMAPMGDMKMDDKMMMGDDMMMVKDPESYLDTLTTLQKGQSVTDRGLINTLFSRRLFTMDPLRSPRNERAFGVIQKYLSANYMCAMPARLKYTNLAPRAMYVSPMIPR